MADSAVGVLSISLPKSLEIIPLSREYRSQAARIYAQGLLMEKPPGSSEPLDELVKALELHLQIALGVEENRIIWLAMKRNIVKGLLDFYHRSSELVIRFICAIPPRQRTGSLLMYHLARYGLQHQIDLISATVSSLDDRAYKFYFSHLEFQKVGSRFDEPGFELFLAEVSPQTLIDIFDVVEKK
jgi:hypothetical protein